MRRRIEAGLSDPRFRVVFGAIMWDARVDGTKNKEGSNGLCKV
jgi:hypothetical protein